MPKSAFVIMPIGDQSYGDLRITETELRERYDHLIREALLKASPNLEVTRADDVAMPGNITSDIITRIMHADIVVADITFPNPNVFYELGLRHACHNGTIIIKDREGPRAPFDIAHLRYIEYENTPAGLTALANRLRSMIAYFDRNPDSPDSSFQEIAKHSGFRFPNYSEESRDELEPTTEAVLALMGNPELFDLMMRSGQGEEIDQKEMLRLMGQNPAIAKIIVNALQKTGQLDLSLPAPRASSAGALHTTRPGSAKRKKNRRK
uniref:Nucleoside 2-deoxyribosyltransferase n=1 Tax=Candidatus Kentrum sp. LPFa TaxID=2126335 RepID=A0A450XSY5_9GAMM|nr:MAG: hypothetical protein BECKLPF1236A_GA0070988_101607 [Candidatus Kentron sp. LPFa]VFK32389.1 MAG: hypothetical protein BECKLPF1236C_GA0070990_101656 [Candidatus Kentron sp. LPFa]